MAGSSAPDNIAFDPKGRIWIASDGANDFDIADGLYAADTMGDGRALPRFFFACPTGAELRGPAFTPDGKTLFVVGPASGRGFGEAPTS